MISALLGVLVALSAQPPDAAPVRDPAIAVDFAADRAEEGWIAAALEENALRDLSGHRVVFLESNARDCPDRDAACLVSHYAAAGSDIVLLGRLTGPTLELDVYEGWLRNRIGHHTIDLTRKPTMAWMRQLTIQAVSPFFTSGGLLEKKPFIVSLPPSERALDWSLPMIGGALWAGYLLLLLGLAVPVITGLGNIRHANVGRTLRAWIVTTGLRTLVLAVLHVPAAVAVIIYVPEQWMLLVPVVGLALHFALLGFVDLLAHGLDRSLVSGPPTVANPWHPVIEKYFLGYVRRAGLSLDRKLLARTLFLPGSGPRLASYGGGLGRARIVVPIPMLEAALHPLTDEQRITEEEKERALDLGDAAGFIIPGTEEPKRKAKRTNREVRLTRVPVRPLLGQNETLLGFVAPLPKGESVPLVIDDPDDYSVLRELLTAHYSAFDRGLYGEEADDTDPTQLDFLFGALLREIGCVQRRDTIFSTLARRLGYSEQKVGRAIVRYPVIIADAYPALNRGLHHLIQYLAFVRGGAVEQMTARADEPTLTSTSQTIIRALPAAVTAPEDRRLSWLSQHLAVPIREERRSRIAKLMTAAAFLIGIGVVVATAVRESVDYHARQKGTPENGQGFGK